jgi:catechol 2,3-dioxygenase-like lactoylglutathione lyase family enzyme
MARRAATLFDDRAGPHDTNATRMNGVIDHVSLGVHDLAASSQFHAAVLGVLGLSVQSKTADAVAIGTAGRWALWLYAVPEREGPVHAPRMHLAWRAAHVADVDRAFAVAERAGARTLLSPRQRPDISEGHYGAMFCCPEGHRIELLCDGAGDA